MRKFLLHLTSLFLLVALGCHACPLSALATAEELLAEAEARKEDTVETNEIPGWPQGPAIGAEAALLMDTASGAILYAKNIDVQLYPASITKLMCCLVAIERCGLDEKITVNQSALDANDSDGSSMSLSAGEVLTLEELLYGILINSANEACNAVAEHIAGSIDAYVDLMNERATALGCTGTHFVTTNGLHREGHVTTAHDMALIGQAFFSHDILCKIANTADYTLPATEEHAQHALHSKNKLYPGTTYAYDGLIGSKTGFTSNSRQTLVSCAQRGDLRLVCVILKEESPYQFEDTVALFDYGFAHFSKIAVADYETGYGISNSDFFDSDTMGSIYGSTSPLIHVDADEQIVLPEGIPFDALDSEISYEGLGDDEIARIVYRYHGQALGSAAVQVRTQALSGFAFREGTPTESPASDKIYINIYHVVFILVAILLGFLVLSLIWKFGSRLLAHQRRVAQIKRHRGEIVKTRATLRRNYRRHAAPMTMRKAPGGSSPVSDTGFIKQTRERRPSTANRPKITGTSTSQHKNAYPVGAASKRRKTSASPGSASAGRPKKTRPASTAPHTQDTPRRTVQMRHYD